MADYYIITDRYRRPHMVGLLSRCCNTAVHRVRWNHPEYPGLVSIGRRPETLGEHIHPMRAEYPDEEV